MTYKNCKFKVGDKVIPFKLSNSKEYDEFGFSNNGVCTMERFFGEVATISEISRHGIYLHESGAGLGWNESDLKFAHFKTVTSPFDLEKAKNGAKLVTMDGHSVKFVAHDPTAREETVIINKDGWITKYYDNGQYFADEESHYDLLIEEEIQVNTGLKAVQLVNGKPEIVKWYDGETYLTQPFEVEE